MDVVGICGSPRKGGNSDVLLAEALRGASGRGGRAVMIPLRDLAISPCSACEKAGGGSPCAVSDGMGTVYDAVRGAGAVILATPIYFGGVSAQMKAMIDRFQCAWLAERRSGASLFPGDRACAFIAVSAGDRPDFFANARAVARNWCATVHGRWIGELYCPGVEERGEAGGRPGMMRAARELGERLIEAAGRPAAERTEEWRRG